MLLIVASIFFCFRLSDSLSDSLSEGKCDGILDEHKLSYYDSIKLPYIEFSSLTRNDMLSSMIFSESMHKYGSCVIVLDNIMDQEIVDKSYNFAKLFFENTSLEFRKQFSFNSYAFSDNMTFPIPGFNNFAVESAKQYLLNDSLTNATLYSNDVFPKYYSSMDIDQFQQTVEPLESFFLISDFNKKTFVPKINELPLEYHGKYSQKLWNVYHKIFENINKLISISLGLKYDFFNNISWNIPFVDDNNNVTKILYDNVNLFKYQYFYGFDKNENFGNKIHNTTICDYRYRYGTHFDSGFYSIIKVDNSGGLQLLYNKTYYNIDITQYPPNSFVIFASYLMDFWTNNYWKAPLHRVIGALKPKLTMVMFTYPKYDTIIDVIPGCYICNNHPNINNIQNTSFVFNHKYLGKQYHTFYDYYY